MTKTKMFYFRRFWVNPFTAPEPLPILNPSNFVPKNGFPVVKGLRELRRRTQKHFPDESATSNRRAHASTTGSSNKIIVVVF